MLAVDPAVLAGAGVSVLGVGEGLMPAVAALSAGFHANTGQDSAGVMFGRQYADAADAVLAAVAAGINACAQTGYGVQVSAVNYSRAEAMSDVSGRAQPLGSPSCPVPVSAPAGPTVTGAGVGEPLLWAVVAMLVGDLWPSGSPAGMRAAAGAWRAFGAVLDGVGGELAAPSAVVGDQQIPEAEQIVSVLRGIGSDFAGISAQCAAVAAQLEGFAADVEATQNAIRDLLARLGSIGGIVGEFFQFLRGHGEEELERIAADIRTVQGHLRNEASAKRAALGQVKAAVDSWVLGLEKSANRQFTEFFGEDVGRVLSVAFNNSADSAEGGFRWLVSNYEGLEDLNPARLFYDPAGAAATWKGLDQFARVAINPTYLADLWRTDPEAAEAMVKGLVRADEWDSQRPMLGLSQNALDIATLPFAAGGAAKAGDAASMATRVAREGEVLDQGGALPGIAGKLGEAGRAGGALDQVAKNSGELTAKLEKAAAPVADKAPVGGKPVGLEKPSVIGPGAVVEKGPAPAPSESLPAHEGTVSRASEPSASELPSAPSVLNHDGYWSHAPEAATDLNDAFLQGHPTVGLARDVADLSTHRIASPVNDAGSADRVVLGKWAGKEDGYIGEALRNGGVYYDTGPETWEALCAGLNDAQSNALAWSVNEQFLIHQMENRVGRIEFVLPEEFDSVEQLASVRRLSFSALEINFLKENAGAYGYRQHANVWTYEGSGN